MPKRDDLIHQIFEGERADSSRSAEAQMWKSVKADLRAMKDQAPECQVTFDHLEGRLYAETVRTQPRFHWATAAAAGCLVLGGAYVFGLQMGRQNTVVPTVAMSTPTLEQPAGDAGLRDADIDDLISAPELPAMDTKPLIQEAPPALPAQPVEQMADKPAAQPAARRQPTPKRTAAAPQTAAVSIPSASEKPAPVGSENLAKPALARGDGGFGAGSEGAGAPMAAMSPTSDELDSAPAVVVVPSIPRGRSGAPVAIENPVMSDIVFGG